VLKKLGLSDDEFIAIMKLPVRKHQEFKTDTRLKASYMNLLVRTAPVRNKIKKIFFR
jgi:agmatine/peptidylarginine deiminase